MLRVRGHGDALLARQVHVDGPTPADVDSRQDVDSPFNWERPTPVELRACRPCQGNASLDVHHNNLTTLPAERTVSRVCDEM